MTERTHTELLAMILPPQGRLAVAATDSAGLLPGPGLVIALEHKTAAGSQTLAGLLDRDRVRQLQQTLLAWLVATDGSGPSDIPAAAAVQQVMAGTLETADENTVAQWLESGAERLDP